MDKVVDITPIHKRTPKQVLEGAADLPLSSVILLLVSDEGKLIMDSSGLNEHEVTYILEKAKTALVLGLGE